MNTFESLFFTLAAAERNEREKKGAGFRHTEEKVKGETSNLDHYTGTQLYCLCLLTVA